jgi:hypothetical protein
MVTHAAKELTGILGFLFLFYAAGSFLDRGVHIKIVDSRQRRLILVCLGMVGWIYFTFLLGVLQLFYTAVVVAAMALCLLTYLAAFRQDWLPALQSGGDLPRRLSPAVIVFLIAAGGVLLFLFVEALSSHIAADAQNYHLFIPQRYIMHHGFYFIPFKPLSNWPANVEMLFLLALIVKDFMLANLVHFLAGALTLLTLYLLCRERAGRFAGLFAAFLFLMNEVVRWIWAVCYTELVTALFFLLAFWFVIKSLEEQDSEKRHLLLAGIFTGAMAGTKLNAFQGGIVLCVVYLSAKIRSGHFRRSLGRLLLYFGVPSVGLLAPWLIKSAVMTGNPVYPLLHSVFGGPEWNMKLSQSMDEVYLKMGMGRTLLDYVCLPFRVIWYGNYDFAHFFGVIDKTWIAFVPLSALFGIRLPIVRRAMCAAGLYFCCWAAGTQQMRHLIPILALLSVAGALTLAHWISRISGRRIASLVKAAFLVAASVYLVYTVDLDRSVWGSPSAYTMFVPRPAEEQALDQYVNRRLPTTARILIPSLWYGFSLDRDVIAENVQNAHQIAQLLLSGNNESEIYKTLTREKFTHVLTDTAHECQESPPAFCRMLKNRQYLLPVFRNSWFTLYQLLPQEPKPPSPAMIPLQPLATSAPL